MKKGCFSPFLLSMLAACSGGNDTYNQSCRDHTVLSFEPALTGDGAYAIKIDDGAGGECHATIATGTVESDFGCLDGPTLLPSGSSRDETDASAKQGFATSLASVTWPGLSDHAKVKVSRDGLVLADQTVSFQATKPCPPSVSMVGSITVNDP